MKTLLVQEQTNKEFFIDLKGGKKEKWGGASLYHHVKDMVVSTHSTFHVSWLKLFGILGINFANKNPWPLTGLPETRIVYAVPPRGQLILGLLEIESKDHVPRLAWTHTSCSLDRTSWLSFLIGCDKRTLSKIKNSFDNFCEARFEDQSQTWNLENLVESIMGVSPISVPNL